MSGPPKKPTAIRILEGNRGRLPINHREPQPSADNVACPGWLDSYARREWRRVLPELHRLRLLTVVDVGILAGYCQNLSRARQADLILAKEGLTFETASGYQMPRPEVAISQKSWQLAKAFALEFGFSPAARTRIAQPEPKRDTLDDLLV